ncbi:MAG: polynucleotide adenylyltransferase PcnB [Gammaproteobacteria bacterium]|nr:polynucleotide adenylyltransferase PcnB [Gammaproteobacteria bacterium]MDP6616272.1 polynucleotide adenylyltransferase PcnB [Gammaproteobacteria bacterium]MDP6695421.1 polynucleotide adenylyltransferase PcnB [Gammaproteobacteria bacterium]
MESPSETADDRNQVIPRDQHNISRANISNSALKVLYRLKDGGYQAYLVGGSVRDLLLGGHPKDFDIATDATPEQVRALFNNSRMIGRRFRLVHVRFGREIIEVATFRAPANHDDDDHEVAEESGRVLRDNVWGTFEEDVWRRDFTCNALYYDIKDYSVRDYVGGVEDIRNRQLRLIGDPEQRYREDPVRMLRAVRFAAKLRFEVEPGTAEPIGRLAGLLDNIPAARLFDEFGKLFQAGHALNTWRALRYFGLLSHLLPLTAEWLGDDVDGPRSRFIEAALENTDKRVADDQPVTPMFLLAVYLWGPVRERADYFKEHEEMSEVQSLVAAGAELSAAQNARIAVPKRFSYPMREIMQMQPRFERRRGKRAHSLLEHRRFRAAYDLFLLRVHLGEVEQEAADWWTNVQELPENKKKLEFAADKSRAKPRRRRRRPRKRT